MSHRNRPGASGLDPMDTYREAAYAEGLFYRRLFTGRLRTRNEFYITLMAVFGAVMVFPLLAVLYERVAAGTTNQGL